MDSAISGEGVSFTLFYSTLRNFPFRTTYTSALTGYSNNDEKETLQKCTSIVDGSKIVNCADPPPPENWWSVSISIILIVAIIIIWIFGCLFSKAYE